jgi:putative endonuclease
MNNASFITGLTGEEIAQSYLEEQGMRCLESRHREKTGEIDLIMEEGETLVFVEVKTRFSDGVPGNGLRAVNKAKQKRIAKSAMLYLMKHRWTNRYVRFDVVEVNRDGVLHIPNAFQPGGMLF